MNDIARMLVAIGFVLVLAGAGLFFMGKIPWLGRLPGDIFIKKENFVFYFPLTTGILLSIILSFLFYLWQQK